MIKIKIGPRAPAAVAAILDDKDHILLLKRTPQDHWAPGKWAFPGGKIEKNETPLEGAIRETEEETTLRVNDLKEIEKFSTKDFTVFYTRNYAGSVRIDHEHEDWRWLPRTEVKNFELAPRVLEIYDWVLNNGS